MRVNKNENRNSGRRNTFGSPLHCQLVLPDEWHKLTKANNTRRALMTSFNVEQSLVTKGQTCTHVKWNVLDVREQLWPDALRDAISDSYGCKQNLLQAVHSRSPQECCNPLGRWHASVEHAAVLSAVRASDSSVFPSAPSVASAHSCCQRTSSACLLHRTRHVILMTGNN